ncbi:hypothetical protein [Spirosoma sp. KNUC1025]|uniref:hypothetical protein n=1 Tax=Spirosoma sp. KNUC1025 TaxID=2894082 RepID=UPI003864303F|nr:hypothetical protein LN737_19120 [Spirosoma sp. KNUC1025]
MVRLVLLGTNHDFAQLNFTSIAEAPVTGDQIRLGSVVYYVQDRQFVYGVNNNQFQFIDILLFVRQLP